MAILISLLVASVIYADSPASRMCSVDDLQACKSCKSLSRVLSKADPDYGEYLHGAEWNGLYAAYVHDCQALAEDLLKRGANPNRGGALGSMIISVIGKWPHNNKKVNQRWTALLLKNGASIRKKVPHEDKTPQEVMKAYGETPEYADLWSQFQQAEAPK